MNIHVIGPDDMVAHDTYEVWLDTDIDSFDGLCIGVGETKAEAILNAQHALREMSRHLNELVWQSYQSGSNQTQQQMGESRVPSVSTTSGRTRYAQPT